MTTHTAEARTAATTKPGQTLPHVPGTENDYVSGTRSLATYDIPSRSDQSLYGDDILVNLWQMDDNLFCSPATVRVPAAMPWGDFYTEVFLPYVKANPATQDSDTYVWQCVDQPLQPEDAKTLEELGVKHKNTLGFRKA